MLCCYVMFNCFLIFMNDIVMYKNHVDNINAHRNACKILNVASV